MIWNFNDKRSGRIGNLDIVKEVRRGKTTMKQYKVNITITVSLDSIKEIDSKCKDGLTRSAVIEKAISAYLAHNCE